MSLAAPRGMVCPYSAGGSGGVVAPYGLPYCWLAYGVVPPSYAAAHAHGGGLAEAPALPETVGVVAGQARGAAAADGLVAVLRRAAGLGISAGELAWLLLIGARAAANGAGAAATGGGVAGRVLGDAAGSGLGGIALPVGALVAVADAAAQADALGYAEALVLAVAEACVAGGGEAQAIAQVFALAEAAANGDTEALAALLVAACGAAVSGGDADSIGTATYTRQADAASSGTGDGLAVLWALARALGRGDGQAVGAIRAACQLLADAGQVSASDAAITVLRRVLGLYGMVDRIGPRAKEPRAVDALAGTPVPAGVRHRARPFRAGPSGDAPRRRGPRGRVQ